MTLTNVDTELAETARLIALARLASVYDTTTWVDVATTPKLVRAIISMFVSAWEYQRAYGEEEDSSYGRRRERQAYDLLDNIVSGELALEEYPGAIDSMGSPSFYPSDESNAAEVYTATGEYVGANDDVKFRMSGNY